jgi:hypothetical protein
LSNSEVQLSERSQRYVASGQVITDPAHPTTPAVMLVVGRDLVKRLGSEWLKRSGRDGRNERHRLLEPPD